MFNPPPIPPEVIITRGREARELLANATFQNVIDDLTTYHLQALVQAPPGPAAQPARDHHHLFISALREIGEDLQAREAAGREMEEIALDGNEE